MAYVYSLQTLRVLPVRHLISTWLMSLRPDRLIQPLYRYKVKG
jgi:hypothetical protein